MADSRSFLGASPVAWIAACCESFQLLLFQRTLPLPSNRLRNGSASTPGTLNGGWARAGPSPRSTTDLEPVPVMVNPAMATPGTVWTGVRAEEVLMLVAGMLDDRSLSMKCLFALCRHF